MRKKTILTATILTVATLATTTVRASALSLESSQTLPLAKTNPFSSFLSETAIPAFLPDPVKSEEKPPEPQPVRHTVAPGESLSAVAKLYDKPWVRLWNANPELETPDLIAVGQVLLIPGDGEQFPDRPLPVAPVIEPLPTITHQAPRTSVPASVASNTYSYGYCTWYVKNRRPDIPNGLGNANRWLAGARAAGLPTGSTPRVGAIGTSQRGAEGHVVYVEAVNGDGTILISEMNHKGWNVQSSRTVSSALFSYIY